MIPRASISADPSSSFPDTSWMGQRPYNLRHPDLTYHWRECQRSICCGGDSHTRKSMGRFGLIPEPVGHVGPINPKIAGEVGGRAICRLSLNHDAELLRKRPGQRAFQVVIG